MPGLSQGRGPGNLPIRSFVWESQPATVGDIAKPRRDQIHLRPAVLRVETGLDRVTGGTPIRQNGGDEARSGLLLRSKGKTFSFST